jgi:hypothetical protein
LVGIFVRDGEPVHIEDVPSADPVMERYREMALNSRTFRVEIKTNLESNHRMKNQSLSFQMS